MATFPLLTSGAVTQHPMTFGSGQAVQVIRFLDGTEQRFLNQGRVFRRWQINLTQLTDIEISALEEFFEQLSGDYSLFTFPDPLSRSDVLNCRIGDAEFSMESSDVNSSLISFWVIETNG